MTPETKGLTATTTHRDVETGTGGLFWVCETTVDSQTIKPDTDTKIRKSEIKNNATLLTQMMLRYELVHCVCLMSK